MNKDRVGILCAVVCEILFGFSFLFTKKIIATVSPMTLLSWRFAFAFLLMTACIPLRLVKINLRGKRLLPLFLVAVFQPVLYFIGETLGIKLTTASESGTFISVIPITTLIFSALILKESPRRLQVFGIIVTVAGVLVIVLMKGLDASLSPAGYAMLLVAVVSASLYAVFSRKAENFTSVEKTYAMMALGAVVFTAAAVTEHAAAGTLPVYLALPFVNADFLIAILYLGAGCSVVAFLLFNTAIATLGTNRSAAFVGISTVVTVTASIILLQEQYTALQGVGTALVIAGVYMANLRKKELIAVTQS